MNKISLKENNLDLNEVLQAIKSLPINVPSQEKEIEIIENNTNVSVIPDSGKTLSKVNIITNIPTQEKEIEITENGNYEIIPDGNCLLSKVTVNTEVSSGLAKYLAGETETITDSTVYMVKDYAFQNYSEIQGFNFPNCSEIKGHAFQMCYKLRTAEAENCTKIGWSAFNLCSSLYSVNFLNCTYINYNAFTYCENLRTVNFPKCSYIGNSAFYGCDQLNTVNIPMCQKIGSGAFNYCSHLRQVDMINCQSIGDSAFYHCDIYELNLPYCLNIGSYAFAYCSSLRKVFLSSCSGLSSGSIFLWCSTLSTVVLRNPKLMTLGTTLIFGSTPIADSSYLGYYGSIYVPLSLVSSYKTATNWTRYSDRIVGIPEINFSDKIYMLPNEQKTFNIKLEGFTSSPNASFNNPNNIFVRMQGSTSSINLTLQAPAEEMTLSGLITINYNGIPIEKSFTIIISNNPIVKDYSIESLGTTYTFNLNGDGYYESNNKGIDSSFALCKVNINTTVDTEMYIDCINYAESSCDFGILSKLDTPLTLDNSEDNNSNVQKNFKGSQSSSIQTVQYSVPAGEHFIYIKYRKDYSVNNNNDSLQFKIRFE